MEQKRFEYRIVPDARREEALDIFSIDEVTGVMSGSSETVDYEPFFSHRHSGGDGPTQTFWHSTRKLSGWRTNKASDVYITFVDLTGAKKTPDKDTVTMRLTCSNGELPSRLPFGNEEGDFQLGIGGPITRIVALTKPTDALQPPSEPRAALASGFQTVIELSVAGFGRRRKPFARFCGCIISPARSRRKNRSTGF